MSHQFGFVVKKYRRFCYFFPLFCVAHLIGVAFTQTKLFWRATIRFNTRPESEKKMLCLEFMQWTSFLFSHNMSDHLENSIQLLLKCELRKSPPMNSFYHSFFIFYLNNIHSKVDVNVISVSIESFCSRIGCLFNSCSFFLLYTHKWAI